MSPLELVARHLLPYLRGLVALELAGRGFGQSRIARLLGLTQPMVAKYMSLGREKLVEKLRQAGIDVEEAQSVARVLAEALARGRVQDYVRIMTSYAIQVLKRGQLCSLHRSVLQGLPADCRLCETLLPSPRDHVVEEVELAYRLLLEHPLAHLLVPEVGSNIVAAPAGAKTVADIVGFTGRIVRVGDRVEAVGEPSYGGSRHTATVLLAAMAKWPWVRAAFVARMFEECENALEKLGLRYAYSGPHKSPRHVLDGIRARLKRLENPIDVLLDKGGPGVEPVAYFFATTAVEAVAKAIRCLEKLLERRPVKRGSVHP